MENRDLEKNNLQNIPTFSSSEENATPFTEIKVEGVQQKGSDSNKKLIIAVIILFVIAVAGGVLLANLYLKQNQVSEKERQISTPQPTQVSEPTSQPIFEETESTESAISTISDDTSIETIEKEIENLDVQGIDQGDALIESDLQNL